jgi:hypothetical protein
MSVQDKGAVWLNLVSYSEQKNQLGTSQAQPNSLRMESVGGTWGASFLTRITTIRQSTHSWLVHTKVKAQMVMQASMIAFACPCSASTAFELCNPAMEAGC